VESDALQIGVISRAFYVQPPTSPAPGEAGYQAALESSELCDQTSDPGDYGEAEAIAAFPLYQRWLENGGRIDYVQVDFPIWRTLSDIHTAELLGSGDCGPDPNSSGRIDLHTVWTVRRMAQEIAAFMKKMQEQVDDVANGLTSTQMANYDPDVFLWAAVGLEHSPGDSGASDIANGEELVDVLECVRFYLEGGDSSSSCYESGVTAVTGNPKLEGVSIDADPNYVENQGRENMLPSGTWDFSRVIEMQRIAREEGYEVSISNHMGPCGQGKQTTTGDVLDKCKNDDAATATDFNEWARTNFLRYADEFVDAGGRPDHLMLNQWLYYPETWGTEFDDPTASEYSLSEIAKEVLTETYPRLAPLDYLDEDFANDSNWQDHNSCYSASASGSVQILEDASTTNGSSGRCSATLKTDSSATAELMADFDLTFNIKWTAGTDWAGVTFRKTDPTDLPWDSGYLVFVDGSQTVSLFREGPRTWSGTLEGDPTTGDGVELTIVARGDWIRVYEGQNETPVINIVDSLTPAEQTAGITLESSGHIGLATLNASAYFAEPFTVTRRDQQTFGDFFEGYDTSTLGSPWTSIVGWTVDTSDATAQKLASSSSVNSSATVDGFSGDDVRISGTITPGGVGLWGGLQVRKDAISNTAMPWATGSGYSAVLKEIAGQAELSLYCKDCTAGGIIQTKNLASVPADGYVVDLVAIGDRIQVYVDGALEIDHWETGAGRPTSGTAGVAAIVGAGTEIDDVFVMEPLN
ncbi:MAG: hypothetical protein AAFY88_09325, partial [Acidobacteriota bacterium]